MIKANSNVRVRYGVSPLTDITSYLNEFELATTISEIETTNLASTTQTYIPSMAEYTLSLSGDWLTDFDAIFGPDIVNPVMRTVKIAFFNPALDVVTTPVTNDTVVYLWTNNAFITGYNISASSGDKVTHSATLRLSGPPTRTLVDGLPTS